LDPQIREVPGVLEFLGLPNVQVLPLFPDFLLDPSDLQLQVSQVLRLVQLVLLNL